MNCSTKILLFGLVAISLDVRADFLKVGTVDLVLTSKKTAEVTVDSDFAISFPAQLYLGTKEKNCEVLATKKVDNKMQVRTETCPDEIKVGMEVYYHEAKFEESAPAQVPIAAPVEVQQTIQPPPEKTSFFSVGFGLRLNNTLRYDKVTATNGSSTIVDELEYESDVPVVFDINFMNSAKQAWGWSAGLTRFEVDWTSVKDSQTEIKVKASTTVTDLYFNAVYRWDNVFLPFGVNFSTLSSSDSAFLSANDGGAGAQLGVGFLINRNFTVILESKVITFSGAKVTQGGVTLTSEAGFCGGLNAVAFYTF